MGSYNVGCSISNISIDSGDKVAFIPLFPSTFKGYEPEVKIEATSNIVSNEGCYALYNCLSLPIFGNYNEYGGVENIEESPTTKAIEKHFGITIEQFMDVVTSSSGVENVYGNLSKDVSMGLKWDGLDYGTLPRLGFKRDGYSGPAYGDEYGYENHNDYSVDKHWFNDLIPHYFFYYFGFPKYGKEIKDGKKPLRKDEDKAYKYTMEMKEYGVKISITIFYKDRPKKNGRYDGTDITRYLIEVPSNKIKKEFKTMKELILIWNQLEFKKGKKKFIFSNTYLNKTWIKRMGFKKESEGFELRYNGSKREKGKLTNYRHPDQPEHYYNKITGEIEKHENFKSVDLEYCESNIWFAPNNFGVEEYQARFRVSNKWSSSSTINSNYSIGELIKMWKENTGQDLTVDGYELIDMPDFEELFNTNRRVKFQYPGHKFYVSIFPPKKKEDGTKPHTDGMWYVIKNENGRVLKEGTKEAGYYVTEKLIADYKEVTGFDLRIRPEYQEKARFLSIISGMFVHRDIFDHLAKPGYGDYGSNIEGTFGDSAYMNEFSLKLLGFEFDYDINERKGEEEKAKSEKEGKKKSANEELKDRIEKLLSSAGGGKDRERYSKIYRLSGVDTHVVMSDGTWCHIAEVQKNGTFKRLQASTHHPRQFVKVWEKLTGTDMGVSEETYNQSKYYADYDKYRQELKNCLEDEFYKKSRERDEREQEAIRQLHMTGGDDAIEDYIEHECSKMGGKDQWEFFFRNKVKEALSYEKNYHRHPSTKHPGIHLHTQYPVFNSLAELYDPIILAGEERDAFVNYMHFYWNSLANNKLFMPSSNGFQCGSHRSTRALAQKMLDIMNDKIQEEELEEA